MVEKAVVESIQRYPSVLNEQRVPAAFCVLYGSQVDGTFGEWSDMDLLVVSSRFDQERSREEWANLLFFSKSSGSRIEPTPCGEIEWREDDSNLIIEAARREGVVVRIGEPASSTISTAPLENS
jgi:predicted nucleotidyltransferase